MLHEFCYNKDIVVIKILARHACDAACHVDFNVTEFVSTLRALDIRRA